MCLKLHCNTILYLAMPRPCWSLQDYLLRLKAGAYIMFQKSNLMCFKCYMRIEEHMIYWSLCLQIYWVTKITLSLIAYTEEQKERRNKSSMQNPMRFSRIRIYSNKPNNDIVLLYLLVIPTSYVELDKILQILLLHPLVFVCVYAIVH